ncbi:uncharacterized protein BJX67DRAFT_361755 [Aspergillus lucknowensis]|uniref:Uncharacterized protein n=1 Tax=Aspergillus lucknowensis TaxID=176173 RepID=A0ABR4LI12_9EURO
MAPRLSSLQLEIARDTIIPLTNAEIARVAQTQWDHPGPQESHICSNMAKVCRRRYIYHRSGN